MITLKQYLDRLEFSAAPSVDASGLSKLQERHLITVPFENLDIYYQRPIALDEEKILEKIVERRRGGFCFELNTAFAWLLRKLGFSVTLLEARVIGESGDLGIPYDHLVLKVDLDESYLVDVGYGRGFLNPLPLQERDDIKQRGVLWRLKEQEGSHLCLERLEAGSLEFQEVYQLSLNVCDLGDFSEACHYHQTSKDSVFTEGILCSIAAPDGRITIRDRTLLITRHGRKEEIAIKDEDDLERQMKRYFRISIAALQDK